MVADTHEYLFSKRANKRGTAERAFVIAGANSALWRRVKGVGFRRKSRDKYWRPVSATKRLRCVEKRFVLAMLIGRQPNDVGHSTTRRSFDREFTCGLANEPVGLAAIYRLTGWAKPKAGDKIYPYSFTSLLLLRPTHIWEVKINRMLKCGGS